MNTLEAIQYLLVNPDEIITTEDSDGLRYFAKNDTGAIMSCDSKGNMFALFSLSANKLGMNWQVVKKPPKQVPWQEAIQAWIDGEGFIVEYPSGSRIVFPGNYASLEDYARITITKSIFRDCKFYIES